MKIKKLITNWHQADAGEGYDLYIVGSCGVTKILNATPENYTGPGIFDIHFENGSIKTNYNPNEVFYVK